jgi:hypothetical protein
MFVTLLKHLSLEVSSWKKPSTLVLLWGILVFPLFAQQKGGELSVAAIPPELLENANAVIRDFSVQVEVKGVNKMTELGRFTITVLNGEADFDGLSLFYDSYSKIVDFHATLFDFAGKQIKKSSKADIWDQSAVSRGSMYEDNRMQSIRLFHHQYPYTVVFEYEIKYNQIMNYPGWGIRYFNTALEKGSYQIQLPEGLDIRYKGNVLIDEPVKNTTAKGTVYQWEWKRLPAIKYEPMSLPMRQLLPSLAVVPTRFSVDGWEGSMTDWQAFGRFLFEINNEKPDLPQGFSSSVIELIRDCESEEEKIAKLYRYLQENTRYVSVQVGLGGWKAFDPTYVETRKYGDCKALSHYMKALLEQAGIPAQPVIIHRGEKPPAVDPGFVSPASFNHMILYLPEQEQWLECTSNTHPAFYVGGDNLSRKALLVTQSGGKLVDMPEMTAATNRRESYSRIDLQPNGRARVKSRVQLIGPRQDWYRYQAHHLSEKEIRDEFSESFLSSSYNIQSLQIEPIKDRPETTLAFELDVPNYASSGNRIFLQVNQLFQKELPLRKTNERIHPIVLNETFSESDTFDICLPSGYTTESLPFDAYERSSSFGEFFLEFSPLENGVLRLIRQYKQKRTNLPPESFPDVFQFFSDIVKGDGAEVVLKRE